MSIDVNVTNDLVIVTESSEDIVVNVSNAPGPAGPGVPVGGSTGQVLKKLSGTNYDTYWALDAGGVPYSGATGDVNLGEYGLTAGQLTLDTTPTGTTTVGTTRWNDTIGSSETTLKGGSVVLKNGVDLVARVINKVTPNTTLTKASYQAVRVSGAQGQRLAVALAQANNDGNSADTIGLVIETIDPNQPGFIMTVGSLEGINTTGSLQGETWADGDVIYLSGTTPGALTNIKPVAPIHIVVVGYVEYAHANNGKIYVKVMNGWELDELHNVSISSPTDNQVLTYEASTSLWKNKAVSGTNIYTSNGTLTGNRTISTTSGFTLTIAPNTTFSSGKINITETPGGSNSINVAGTVSSENLMWITRESQAFTNFALYQYNTMVFKGNHNPGAGFGNIGGGNVQFNTIFGEGHKFRNRVGLSGQYLFGRGFIVDAGNTTSIGIGTGGEIFGGDIQLVTNSAANVYFGKVTDGNEQKYDAMSTLHGISGEGTNNVGKNFRIGAGRGTGAGSPGNLLFMTANAIASGTTLQTLQYRMGIFGDTGNVIIGSGGTYVPTYSDQGYKLDVQGTGRFTGILYTGNPNNNNFAGYNNNGVLYVKSNTSGEGGLSLAAPSSANLHRFLSLRVDGFYDAWLSMAGGTFSTSGNISTNAISAAGNINARSSILISDNTDNERGINFWREGNAGRASIVHNSAGQLFINTSDAGSSPSSTTGFVHIRLDGSANNDRYQNTLIRSQNNTIGGSANTINVAAVLELKNGNANFYGFLLPTLDTLNRNVIASAGNTGGTNYNADLTNGSNTYLNYIGGGTIQVGDLVFPASQGSDDSYIALKTGGYRAIVTNVSGTTITVDRPYTGTTGNFFVPRMRTWTIPEGIMIYNSTTKNVEYYNGTTWVGTGSNIYNSDGTLIGDRLISAGANKLAIQTNYAFSANNANPSTNIFNVKSSTNENAISVWSNGAVGIGRNAGSASAVNGYALAVDNGNNTGIYTGGLYSVGQISANNGSITLGIYGSKSINIFDGASDGYVSYTAATGIIVSSGSYAGVNYNTTLQVSGGKGIRIFGPTGNVVIGGSTYSDETYKLDVQGTGRFTGSIRTQNGVNGAYMIIAPGALETTISNLNSTGTVDNPIRSYSKIVVGANGDNTTYITSGNVSAGTIKAVSDNTANPATISLNTTTTGATIIAVQPTVADLPIYISPYSKQVGIGMTSGINSSASLQIDATTKGFLPPRMTTTQKNAIGSPAAGLQVYDTTLNQMSYYNGTTWVNF